MFNNFGEFLKAKREESRITLRQMARLLDISAPFLSDVEKDRRNPLDIEKLNMLSEILSLSTEDKTLMFDLAGAKRNAVAPDLPDYIKGRDVVIAALRTARDLDASEEEWQRFIDDLKRRKEQSK